VNQLYDLGYMEIGNIKSVEKAVKELDAILLDVRFSPRSRNPQYNKSFLEKVFNTNPARTGYLPVKDLGNRNYKGGPVDFVDIENGLAIIHTWLEIRPVILMCGCWNRAECHRLEIANTFHSAYGVQSIPLNRELSKSLADLHTPKQLDIFGEIHP
jgi:hypothetical protein